MLRDETSADWEQLRPVIDEALAELNERDRCAVLLRFFEGRAFAEIGAALAVSEDAARVRVDRALDRLRTLLGKRDITSTSVALGLALSQQAAAAPPAMALSITSQAIASATMGSPSAVTLISLMSTSKTAIVTLGLALIFATGSVIYEARASRAAEALRHQATVDHETDLARLREAEQLTLAATNDAAKLRAEIASIHSAAGTPRPGTSVVDERTRLGNAFLDRHPEVRNALQRYANARTDFEYGPLYGALHLTPEQIEQFHHLIHKGMGAIDSDGKTISMRSGDDISSTETTARLKNLLGEEGYQQYVEFSQNTLSREAVVKVAGGLYFTDTPLTPGQSDQLNQIMADGRNAADRGSSTKYDWAKIIPQASVVLSPPQLEVLKGLEAEDKFVVVLNTPPPEGTYSTTNAPSQHGK